MSWKFSKNEVPQFVPDGRECIACRQRDEQTDRDTGLCRPCWRVVVLGPCMESEEMKK